MRISFSWECVDGNLTPNCSTDFVGKDGIDFIACVLTDDGGQRYTDTIPWLNEGLRRISSVRSGGDEFSDWSRDAWGVRLRAGEVEIYSLHDESCFQTFGVEVFEGTLLAWRDFIQSNPEIGVHKNIEF